MQIMATFTSEKTSPERAQNHGVQTNTLLDRGNFPVHLRLNTHSRDFPADGFEWGNKLRDAGVHGPSGRNRPYDFTRTCGFRTVAESIR